MNLCAEHLDVIITFIVRSLRLKQNPGVISEFEGLKIKYIDTDNLQGLTLYPFVGPNRISYKLP